MAWDLRTRYALLQWARKITRRDRVNARRYERARQKAGTLTLEEIRDRVIRHRLATRGDQSYREVAESLGLTPRHLRTWRKKHGLMD